MPEGPRSPDELEFDIPRHDSAGLNEKELIRPRRPPILLDPLGEDDLPDHLAAPSMPSGAPAISAHPRPLNLPIPHVAWQDTEVVPFATGVYPPDGRSIYADFSYPWTCVAKVLNRPGFGSGVMVGPRHVLTASHVIDWTGPMETVLFTQGGIVIDWVAATNVLTYEKINGVEYSTADDDYAVVVLERALPQLGWMGVRNYDAGWDDEIDEWCNISYAPSFGGGVEPIFQTKFFLDEDELDVGAGRMMSSTTVDFEKGMSGSPIFGFWPDGPYVVGVACGLVSTPFDDYNAVSGGSNLKRLVKAARSRFP